MKDILSCPMHPKAPLVAGILVVLFSLLGLYGSVLFLWLDVVVGAALIYAGATGNCLLSGAMGKCCAAKKVEADKIDLP